jgi:hypothetical protein
MKRIFVFLLLVTASAQAAACSIVIFPPEHEFDRSEVVALARPVSTSFRPKQAADLSYTGSFRETVLWEVLLSWKGPWKSGDRFTTRRTFPESPCNYEVRLRDTDAYLFYGNEREPYKDFRLIPAAQSSHYILPLSKKPVR